MLKLNFKMTFKKVKKYLTGEVNINIIPSPEYKIRSFSVSRLIPFLIIMVILFLIITLGIISCYYFLNNREMKKEILELKQNNKNGAINTVNNSNIIYSENKEQNKVNRTGSNLIYEMSLTEKQKFNIYGIGETDLEQEKSAPSLWPIEEEEESFISSKFGNRKSPETGKKEFHEGLDIGVWYNTPVLATADGEISYAGWKEGYGWTVEIDHKDGYITKYGHLNEIKIKEGEKVKKGSTVALSGNSGRSTGPHLHYEVIKDNEPQNPEKYIPQ